MSFAQTTHHTTTRRGAAATRTGFLGKALKRTLDIDKVAALAILAASAIFAPFAVAVMSQAAKIIAR